MKGPLLVGGGLVMLAFLLAAAGTFLGADGPEPAEEVAEDDWRTEVIAEANTVSYENMEYFWKTEPELRPLIKQAMSDGRLTVREALEIYHTKYRKGLLDAMKEETK